MTNRPDPLKEFDHSRSLVWEQLSDRTYVLRDIRRDIDLEVRERRRVERIEPVELDGVECTERLEHGICPTAGLHPVECVECNFKAIAMAREVVGVAARDRVMFDDDDIVPNGLKVSCSAESSKTGPNDDNVRLDLRRHGSMRIGIGSSSVNGSLSRSFAQM